MRKKLTALALAAFFTVGLSGVSMASKCKGEVVKNEAGEMVIKLKGECKAKAGDSVKIKVKAAQKVEGC
ncbi:MAG: hypothetical protein DSZ23_02560 [Thermodesulfatator sp.]|nr:MAG: hypothetical protein DSZ23_02560 [Thermodesulfatator sp.]